MQKHDKCDEQDNEAHVSDVSHGTQSVSQTLR